MDKYKDFAEVLQEFFCRYLVNERGSSAHTIRSYRDTFVYLIDYFEIKKKISPDKITLPLLTKDNILDFLDWLEEDRANAISTRNQRYAALRSFFKYLMYIDPVHMLQWKLICSIKIKKGTHETINYLTVDGVKCLFEQIDVQTSLGRRNLTMLSLLYNTGARVQELIDLTPSSLRLTKPYIIKLLGKGSKKRIVPLDDDIIRLVEVYLEENRLNLPGKEHYPLFYNVWGEKLTDPGVTYVLHKYASIARLVHPELIPDKISPHVLRHSRAMHLLQAGVNLILIRDLLGHTSVQTTEIYARVDSKNKREALEKAYADVGVSVPDLKSWEKDPKLKAFLKGLAN